MGNIVDRMKKKADAAKVRETLSGSIPVRNITEAINQCVREIKKHNASHPDYGYLEALKNQTKSLESKLDMMIGIIQAAENRIQIENKAHDARCIEEIDEIDGIRKEIEELKSMFISYAEREADQDQEGRDEQMNEERYEAIVSKIDEKNQDLFLRMEEILSKIEEKGAAEESMSAGFEELARKLEEKEPDQDLFSARLEEIIYKIDERGGDSTLFLARLDEILMKIDERGGDSTLFLARLEEILAKLEERGGDSAVFLGKFEEVLEKIEQKSEDSQKVLARFDELFAKLDDRGGETTVFVNKVEELKNVLAEHIHKEFMKSYNNLEQLVEEQNQIHAKNFKSIRTSLKAVLWCTCLLVILSVLHILNLI